MILNHIIRKKDVFAHIELCFGALILSRYKIKVDGDIDEIQKQIENYVKTVRPEMTWMKLMKSHMFDIVCKYSNNYLPFVLKDLIHDCNIFIVDVMLYDYVDYSCK